MFDLIKKIIGSGNGKVQTTNQDILTAHLALTVLLLEAAYADGECSGEGKEHLEAHEDHFAHKLANLLRLNHNELIDAKLRARKQLS